MGGAGIAPKHVLIVDDEPKIGFFLKEALRRSGQDCRVTVVHSGEEALEVLERSQVNLLVTDLRMPGISGLDLIRWVRASSPKTRTILITAYGNDEVEAEVRRLEAYRYITKPFDIADFVHVVEEALEEVALARPGLILFSDRCFEAVAEHLERLRQEIDAQCIFLVDVQGHQLMEVGDAGGMDTATTLALLAGGIAAGAELARQLGDPYAPSLNFHEGARYEIYSATIDENLFLVIVYDRRLCSSRIGLVWLYTRRAIEQLRRIFAEEASSAGPSPFGKDFGASLAAELDTLFAEGEAASPVGGDAKAEEVSHQKEVPCQSKEASNEALNGSPSSELLDLETAIARGIVPSALLSSE